MAKTSEPEVFAYLDYRAFLRDVYLARKPRGFSYRAFSKKAQLRSPNYLKMVIDADRNLTAAMAQRFARALGLVDDAVTYFEDLVAFNQAATAGERARAYARLSNQAQFRKIHKLDLMHAEYHGSWFIPAIRELATRADFSDDPDWIAGMMMPPISRADAKRALLVLEQLDLLVRDANGRLTQGATPLVSTGPETRGVHIAAYHRTMIARGAEAIDVIASHDRDISALTLCVGDDGLTRIKDRVQRFRRELLELSLLEDEPRRVVQLNFQLFPLTQAPSGEDTP